MTRPASTIPGDYMIPEDVLDITGPDPAPVWLNQTGGLTARFDSEHRTRYLNRNPLPSTEDLELEATKLDWLRVRHPVPRVIEHRRRISAPARSNTSMPRICPAPMPSI